VQDENITFKRDVQGFYKDVPGFNKESVLIGRRPNGSGNRRGDDHGAGGGKDVQKLTEQAIPPGGCRLRRQ
jgi:hypothetical protein